MKSWETWSKRNHSFMWKFLHEWIIHCWEDLDSEKQVCNGYINFLCPSIWQRLCNGAIIYTIYAFSSRQGTDETAHLRVDRKKRMAKDPENKTALKISPLML